MLKMNLQHFAAGTGVFPVHNNVFKINTAGRTIPETFVVIKDMESFGISIDGNVEEWTPMDQEGWVRRALTGKGLTVSLSGKRQYGDAGNDYVADTLLATGQEAESILEWTFASGAKLIIPCIISLSANAGGDSTNIDSLEFDILSDGKPTYTPAT